MKNLPQQLKGISIATVFFVSLLYVQAWTGAPAGIPPANNVDAPVNVGDSTQYKSGSLGVGGLLKAYSTFNIPTGAGLGKVLTSDATGNASWQTPPSFSASGSGMTEAELLGRPAWPSSISCGDDPNRVLFKIRTSSPTLVMYYNTQSGYTLYFNNSGLLTAIYAPALTATYGPCVANTSTIESLNDQGRSSTGAGGGISSIAGGNCGAGKVVKSISSIGVATCVTDATGTGGIASESDPTVIASVKDGVDWTEVTNKPTTFPASTAISGSVIAGCGFVMVGGSFGGSVPSPSCWGGASSVPTCPSGSTRINLGAVNGPVDETGGSTSYTTFVCTKN